MEDVENAHEAGLSLGKYRVFLEVQALDPDITPEEVQGMTMREIRELIRELSGSGEDMAEEDNAGNHGHGWNGEDNEGNSGKNGGNSSGNRRHGSASGRTQSQ